MYIYSTFGVGVVVDGWYNIMVDRRNIIAPIGVSTVEFDGRRAPIGVILQRSVGAILILL